MLPALSHQLCTQRGKCEHRRGRQGTLRAGGRLARPLTGAGPDSVELSFAWRAAGSELLSLPKVAAICTVIKSPKDDK